MATLLGIDLGTHSVKMSVHTGRKSDPVRTLSRLVEPGEEGGSLGARLALLAGMLQDLGKLESPTFAVAMPTQNSATRLLRLPFTDAARIEKTIGFALEGFVPFDLADFLLDYRVVPGDGEGARVFCAMAPIVEVGGLLQALDAVDVDPRYLVLDADALGALAPERGVQALVDFGHSRTLVTLCRNGEVLAARALSQGGATLTQALVQQLTLEPALAETLKHAVGLDPEDVAPLPVNAVWDDEDEVTETRTAIPSPEQVAQVLRAAMLPQLHGLRALLIALEDELELGIDELLMVGGGAALRGLARALTEDLGVPARRIELRQLDSTTRAEPHSGRFALSQALSMRAAGLVNTPEINFRKGPFAYKGDVELIRAIMGYALVAAMFFLIVGGGVFTLRFVQYQQQISALETQIASTVTEAVPDVSADRVKESSMAKAIMQEKAIEATTRADALGSVIGQPPPVLSTWLHLAEYRPPHPDVVLDIKELSLTDEVLSFKAETNSYESAAKVETSLQRYPPFAAARKGDEKKSGANVAFSMTIPLTPPPSEEDEG